MARQRGGGASAVVFQARVERGQDFHFVGGETIARAKIGKEDVGMPWFERDVLLRHQELVLVEVDLGGRGDVALDPGARVEWLAGFQPRREIKAGDQDLRLRGIAQGHGVDFEPRGGQAGGGVRGAAGGVVAVAQEDDAAHFAGGPQGAAEVERAAEISAGALFIVKGGPGSRQLAALDRRLPDGGGARKPQHAGRIVRLPGSDTLGHVLPRLGRGGRRDAG